MDFNPAEHQHNRYNPLTGQWILVSPHRMTRPWAGHVEETESKPVQDTDANNPLCPGSVRATGEVNPIYESTFVFDNDFPALKEYVPLPPKSNDPLFKICGALGKCRVICFHPKSSVTLATMTVNEIFNVIEVWKEQLLELGKKYTWVQIFENKGDIMGCSNPHPHCQVWASSFMPNEPLAKDTHQRNYYLEYGRPLLLDYVQRELEKDERLIITNNDWVVLVPYWATWPFETMIIPRFHARRMLDLTEEQRKTLAEIMLSLNIKYDNLFRTTFPYSMGWHGAPTGKYLNENVDHWVFHGIYYPPLLRSASVKKYMVGYEMLAQQQRDMTPERAAQMLRDTSVIHFHESKATHTSSSITDDSVRKKSYGQNSSDSNSLRK